MNSEAIKTVKYDSTVYQIKSDIIEQIGILSGLVEAGIYDLELPLVPDISCENNIIHRFLNSLSIHTGPVKELDIFQAIIPPFGTHSNRKLDDFLKDIESGKYDDITIRAINQDIFILLHAADYWDFAIVIQQIREYISQLMKICDLETVNRWLGGII